MFTEVGTSGIPRVQLSEAVKGDTACGWQTLDPHLLVFIPLWNVLWVTSNQTKYDKSDRSDSMPLPKTLRRLVKSLFFPCWLWEGSRHEVSGSSHDKKLQEAVSSRGRPCACNRKEILSAANQRELKSTFFLSWASDETQLQLIAWWQLHWGSEAEYQANACPHSQHTETGR